MWISSWQYITWLNSAYTIVWNHVKGHQDNASTMVLVPRDSWLNIVANKLACNAIQTASLRLTWYCILHGSWCVPLYNYHLVKQFKVQFGRYVNSPRVVEYWKNCQQLTPSFWEKVNWETLEKSFKMASSGWWRWMSKFALGHFAHGKYGEVEIPFDCQMPLLQLSSQK